MRRTLSTVTIILVATFGQANAAVAWSNGVDGYNSYGTHDWVLDHALDALGDRANWFHEL